MKPKRHYHSGLLLLSAVLTACSAVEIGPRADVLYKEYDTVIYSYGLSSYEDSAHTLSVDINEDGILDFQLYSPRNSLIGGIGNQAVLSSIRGLNGTSIAGEPVGYDVNAGEPFAFEAVKFAMNAVIDSSSVFISEDLALDYFSFPDMQTWDRSSSKIIGFRMMISGRPHYGWALFSLTAKHEPENLGVWRFSSSVKLVKSGIQVLQDNGIKAGER